jgi:hypothetical protein
MNLSQNRIQTREMRGNNTKNRGKNATKSQNPRIPGQASVFFDFLANFKPLIGQIDWNLKKKSSLFSCQSLFQILGTTHFISWFFKNSSRKHRKKRKIFAIFCKIAELEQNEAEKQHAGAARRCRFGSSPPKSRSYCTRNRTFLYTPPGSLSRFSGHCPLSVVKCSFNLQIQNTFVGPHLHFSIPSHFRCGRL